MSPIDLRKNEISIFDLAIGEPDARAREIKFRQDLSGLRRSLRMALCPTAEAIDDRVGLIRLGEVNVEKTSPARVAVLAPRWDEEPSDCLQVWSYGLSR